jgi:regulatory protein
VNEEIAKRLAYKKLAMRSYHSLELTELLIEKGASPLVIEAVICDLKRLGYLNDEAWVADKVRSLAARRYGPRAIAYKLAVKGIPEEEVHPHLEMLGDSQLDQIKQMLASKYRNRDLTDYKERGKIIASLLRKGYDLAAVKEALEK